MSNADAENRKSGGKRAGAIRSKILSVLFVLVFLAGAGILFYPTISNAWNQWLASRAMGDYTETVSDLSKDEIKTVWRKARAYNRAHDVNIIMDAWNDADEYVMSHPYDTLLDPLGNGMMGSIKIPKISVDLPIYHGISAKVLEHGVGHIEGTSLPVGGKGTHSVLSAHRGLPAMKLFTDLDRMEEGDQFFLHIMDKVLAYEVDQIKVVKPKLVKDLDIVKGKDYVTLVTCTPYGVNTHRMLVRGHRVPYVPENEEESLLQWLSDLGLAAILLAAGLFVFLIILIILIKRKKKKDKEKAAQPKRE